MDLWTDRKAFPYSQTEGLPALTVSGINISADTVDSHEPVTLTISATNTGDADGSIRLPIIVDGQLVSESWLRVASGRSASTSRTIRQYVSGWHTLTVGQSDSTLLFVKAGTPARYEYTRLTTPIPPILAVGEQAVLSVDMRNTGGIQGRSSAFWLVNGEEVSTEAVTMDPGEKRTLVYPWMPTVP